MKETWPIIIAVVSTLGSYHVVGAIMESMPEPPKGAYWRYWIWQAFQRIAANYRRANKPQIPIPITQALDTAGAAIKVAKEEADTAS